MTFNVTSTSDILLQSHNRATVQNVTHVALEATLKYMFKTTDFGACRKPFVNGSQSHATDVKVIECYL